MKPSIGLSEKNLKGVTDILSKVLADLSVLYIKTRKFHWNVSGDSFMEYHLLFEGQYKEIENTIDEVAERINKLGAHTIGTMKEYISLSSIKESPGRYPDSREMVKELLKDHESFVVSLRKDINDCDEKYKDAGTTDFLTKIMEDHETIAWKLRRYFK